VATETDSRQRELEAENERLRARLTTLEEELVEMQARTNAVVGEWQERAYWLDRLHIDLNKLMERPGANEVRLALRAVRSMFWRFKRIKRRLSKS
jgi:uncharacterized protein YlxW (UPF0749 family)